MTAATASEVSVHSKRLPLCVDLDGTLIKTDILLEGLLAACRSWAMFKALPGMLLKGKAALKAGLAGACPAHCEQLPYNEEVLRFLRDEKARGRRLVLITASNHGIGEDVNAHLGGLFDEVIGSDHERNLRGEAKARLLVERFGERGFDYVGNDRTDLHVWRKADGALLVDASAGLQRRTAEIARVDRVFANGTSPWLAVIKEIRPYQWVKNLLVFIPIITSGDFTNFTAWSDALITFAAFCAAASSIYVVNDLLDLESDRKHPRKRNRPIASGALPIAAAVVTVPLLALTSIVLAGMAGVLPYVLGYAVMSLSYSIKLKEMPLVDVFLLAALYSVRLYAGGVAAAHEVSLWLLAFSGFLFLGLAIMKRVTELWDLRQRHETDMSRRSYKTTDSMILTVFGANASWISSLVLTLYVQSDVVTASHRNPHALWWIVPLMLFWQCRLWFATSRGYMSDDPIVFTAKDWVSILVAFGLLAAMVLSYAPL